jgi:hypothetical protein
MKMVPGFAKITKWLSETDILKRRSRNKYGTICTLGRYYTR